MKITGTSCYMDVEQNGRIARFSGELSIDGFIARKDSMKWLSPHDSCSITIKDKDKFVLDILRESENRAVKIYFE